MTDRDSAAGMDLAIRALSRMMGRVSAADTDLRALPLRMTGRAARDIPGERTIL